MNIVSININEMLNVFRPVDTGSCWTSRLFLLKSDEKGESLKPTRGETSRTIFSSFTSVIANIIFLNIVGSKCLRSFKIVLKRGVIFTEFYGNSEMKKHLTWQ